MSRINYRSIVDTDSQVIEYRFRIPFDSVIGHKLSEEEQVFAEAMFKGDDRIWLKAALMSYQIRHVEREASKGDGEDLQGNDK